MNINNQSLTRGSTQYTGQKFGRRGGTPTLIQNPFRGDPFWATINGTDIVVANGWIQYSTIDITSNPPVIASFLRSLSGDTIDVSGATDGDVIFLKVIYDDGVGALDHTFPDNSAATQHSEVLAYNYDSHDYLLSTGLPADDGVNKFWPICRFNGAGRKPTQILLAGIVYAPYMFASQVHL